MKDKTVSITLILIIALSLTFITTTVFAGNKNQNDETNGKSVERGTGKINFIDGCAPPEQSGDYLVTMFTEEELAGLNDLLYFVGGAPFLPPLPSGDDYWKIETPDWEGGPCCPSNEQSEGNYPLPNQCCNPPDIEAPHPGNHCICFELRGYPFFEGAQSYPY